MNMKIKEHILFFLIFASIIIYVFFDAVILKAGLIRADYLQQFFPWLNIYANSVKALHLPLWTRYVQCGFPLFAEGQIGALYPMHILFYFFLPFKIAYNYSFLLHFVLSGVFTYFYARKLKACMLGGLISALCICFGSIYAGFLISMPAVICLAWFPLILFLFEKYFEEDKKAYLLIAAAIMGIQFLAGSMQMSFYSLLFCAIYFLHRSFFEKRKALPVILELAVILLIVVLISVPQAVSTWRLSMYSPRAGNGPGFALWGSFSPLSLIGAFLPYVGLVFSKGYMLFVGIIPLFFAFYAAGIKRQDAKIKSLLFVLLLSVFLAFGKYNPAYILIIKLFNFYSFRVPARLLYFGIFSLSVLSGIGFTEFFSQTRKADNLPFRIYLNLLSGVLILFLAAKLIIGFFGQKILQLASSYVIRHIYGEPFHRYSMELYLDKVRHVYAQVLERFSLQNPHTLTALVMLLCAFLVLYRLFKYAKNVYRFKYVCLLLICAELFIFNISSKRLRADFADFNYVLPAETKIVEYLQNDKELFRICPFGEFKSMPLWLRPSLNAFYGLDSISMYSPLINKAYFSKVKDIGVVDDSLGIVAPKKDALNGKLDLLRRLNVKYIVSTVKLDLDSLKFVMQEGRAHLYRVNNYEPRFFFTDDLGKNKTDHINVNINQYSSGKAEVFIDSKREGFLVFSETFYPGWNAYVNGKAVRIQKYMETLQAVRVRPGANKIFFEYNPHYLNFLIVVGAVTVFFVFLYSLYELRKDWA
ncbi:MAG: YfhO family protein [Candidatus Omnitrophota bacterium]